MTPSHYLNQSWLLISEILWHLHESNATVSSQATILCNEFENHILKITATSPRGQWVKNDQNPILAYHDLYIHTLQYQDTLCIWLTHWPLEYVAVILN